MKIVRLSKITFVAAIALFTTLVAFTNIYFSFLNFIFKDPITVESFITLLFSRPSTDWLAIGDAIIQNIGYSLTVVGEMVTAILCWIGCVRMLVSIKAPKNAFQFSKRTAIAGLALGFLVWHIAFIFVRDAWFNMWILHGWNIEPDGLRFFITIILVLIYVVMPDDEVNEE